MPKAARYFVTAMVVRIAKIHALQPGKGPQTVFYSICPNFDSL